MFFCLIPLQIFVLFSFARVSPLAKSLDSSRVIKFKSRFHFRICCLQVFSLKRQISSVKDGKIMLSAILKIHKENWIFNYSVLEFLKLGQYSVFRKTAQEIRSTIELQECSILLCIIFVVSQHWLIPSVLAKITVEQLKGFLLTGDYTGEFCPNIKEDPTRQVVSLGLKLIYSMYKINL